MRALRRRRSRRRQRRKKSWSRFVTAGAAGLLAVGVSTTIGADIHDRHQLALLHDTDMDLLQNTEELAIGYDPFRADQNHNQIRDGVELAWHVFEAIERLPIYPLGNEPEDANSPYKMEHALDGVERCEICGQWIHMGGWEIVNPRLGLRYPDPNDPLDGIFLPDLAIHYLQHGSFSCAGSIHTGRVDLPRLLAVLELRWPSAPDNHELPPKAADQDQDLLSNEEELAGGYDLNKADQDQDLVADGVELARQCAQVIDELEVYQPNQQHPEYLHKVQYFQKGLEHCEICGATVNMGYWLVINPKLKLEMIVPEIARHYLRHGSFGYHGDVHGYGRLDPVRLARILEMPAHCGDLGTLYQPADLNRDCRIDMRDLAELSAMWLTQNESGPLR